MEKNGGNSTIRDMTSGSPVKLIIQFMIPMFLGNIFQQFYNIADSIVAGQFLGVRALGSDRKYRFADVFCHRLVERTQQWICDSRSTVVSVQKNIEPDASLCGKVHLSAW